VFGHLREGDEVMVWKLDRLGGNTRSMLALTSMGAMGKAMLIIISTFAQLEREQLAEQIKTGMAAAAANGRRAGRREITARTGR
jgi:DNA invertase Pin-like site-specific DNA recombinase